jgi:endonuclease YncB( thermonuclease family)
MVLSQESARCVDVVDGDTIVVDTGSSRKTVHLWGIDAPELEQIRGDEARIHLTGLAMDRTVDIDTKDQRSGVETAVVTCDGDDLSMAMAEAGLAFLPKTDPTDERYATAIVLARASRRGMWSADSEVPAHPEDWVAARRASQIPTPTPIPSTLSDIAARVDIDRGDGGAPITNQDLDAKGISLPDSEYAQCMLPLIAEMNRSVETMRALIKDLKYPTDDKGIERIDKARRTFEGYGGMYYRLQDCDASRPDYSGHHHVWQAQEYYSEAARVVTTDAARAWQLLSKGDVEMAEARKAYNQGYSDKQRVEAEINDGNPYPRWR